MNSLENYIQKVKDETEGFSDLKKIRYVYLDLGKRFQFDLDFAFGNTRSKGKIYEINNNKEKLSEIMDDNLTICVSISHIFEVVIKKLGIDIKTIVDPKDDRKYPHTYNVITMDDKQEYRFDLQEDMRFIKSHLRTKYFGISMENHKNNVVCRRELDKIDEEIGYINGDLYYTDEYLELIKMHMNLFEDFGEKVQFVLENLESYTDTNIGYADRKWRMEDLIGNYNTPGLIFSKKDMNKIHLIDCYEEKDGKKEYKLCVAVDVKNGTDIYFFSEETNCFEKKTMDEVSEMVKNGLVNMQGIRGLNKALIRKQSEEGRDEK